MLHSPLPPGPFSVIYADPAWSYRDKCNAGKRGAAYKYPTMKLADIRAMPVADIAAPDSLLFMWATFPLLPEAMAVMEAWGFKYKTVGFTWIKINPKALTPRQCMGNYTRANAEVCLIGAKGKGVKRISASVHSVVQAPIRDHSEKPAEVRDRIVQLVGDVPRIELFARHVVEGWTGWGRDYPSIQNANVHSAAPTAP